MKRIISLILSSSIIMFLFAACGQTQQSETDMPGKPFEKGGKDGYVITYMSNEVNWFTTPTQPFIDVARYYHGVEKDDGSGVVMHATAYNGSDVIFCADGNCSHSDKNCLAFFPTGTKFFALNGSHFPNNMFAVTQESGSIKIYSVILYEENRLLAEFENAMFSMHSNIATDDEYLYLACVQDGKYVVNQISLAGGAVKLLYTAPEDETDLSIQSVSGGNLIVSSYNKNIAPTPTTFFMINIASGDSVMLKRVDYMIHVGEKAGVTIGDLYYEIDCVNNQITGYNFFTGEETPIRNMGFLPHIEEEFTQPRISIKFVMDGLAAAQYLYTPAEGGYKYENLFIDLSNSLYIEPKLLAPDRKGDMVTAPVLAELKGIEIGQGSFVTLNTEGALVMISPTDYRNGNPEYIDFEYWE